MSQPQAIACTRDEMAPDERSRHADLLSRLQSLVERVCELPDGYGGYVPAAEAATVVEWIGLERKCCPFLSFGLEYEPGEELTWLRVTGPEGASELVAEIFGERLKGNDACCGRSGGCSC